MIPYLLGLASCQQGESLLVSEVKIIPKPQEFELGDGVFILNSKSTFKSQDVFQNANKLLTNFLNKSVGFSLPISDREEEADIVFQVDNTIPSEGYTIEINSDQIILKAKDESGAVHAFQSLRQIFPVELETSSERKVREIKLPQLKIRDEPRFKYRGMHLDVGRHFFDKEFIKEYIAHLSMLKMNYFHWHLTEDQGWRIEINRYPKLTSHGAFREETLIGHYNDTPQQFDGKRYGGFYSQEDIREVVAFAEAHNITIIPEIEMPGHAQAAISAYPEFGCTGEQVPVATKWGVFEHIYCPKEETFTFLKNVLDEVIELFPGEYIHIGGDEAPKAQWKACGNCQQLIKDLNLKDEDGLQSYFIKEIETYLNSKGKKIIGWDEILEGGLAPNATVMSWRGTEGAIEAAREGHDVILTPTSHCYFDYYQDEGEDEPLAIGGFLPLKKVYGFDPIPQELTLEQSRYVLGAQGNVWTEYMPTSNQVEYMAFPRMLAMSEVVWKGASENSKEDYPEFLDRVEHFIPRFEALNINAANHLYQVEMEIVKRNGKAFFELNTPTSNKEIFYRIDDGEAQRYDAPVAIDENITLVSEVKLDGRPLGKARFDTIRFHKGLRASIEINKAPHPSYGEGGKEALINGVSGNHSRYGDKEWLGFWGEDVEIDITFSEKTPVSKVTTRFYNANGQWIYVPTEVSLVLIDANDNRTLKTFPVQVNKEQLWSEVQMDLSTGKGLKAKSLLLIVPNYGIIPQGRQGAGNKAWTFIDEIVIE
ncbi:MAG: beta-N-acetylhexosaminidase [Bacteroidia bacterium]|nr:beta-N-acetylhexosaminidase [Bacteroidia bacterium]